MKPLFFSRLLLTAGLRDLHAVHAAVWRGFSDDDLRPFLFRADRVLVDERTRAWKVLVQATARADWSRLGSSLVEAEAREPRTLTFQIGDHFRFFLRANPTAARKGARTHEGLSEDAFKSARGVRMGLRGEQDELAWLERQAKKYGFRLDGVRIAGRRREHWNNKGRNAVFDGVDFEGHLTVEDLEPFEEGVMGGVGRGRAFGFGLLSLARDSR